MSPLLEPLAEFKTADLPKPPTSFWKLAGPGAVLVGLSIGAGEIVVWPRTVAQYGAGMVWAAMLGVFLQMWVNFEIGRWTIATGETVYTGFTPRLARLCPAVHPVQRPRLAGARLGHGLGQRVESLARRPGIWRRHVLGFQRLLDNGHVRSRWFAVVRTENGLSHGREDDRDPDCDCDRRLDHRGVRRRHGGPVERTGRRSSELRLPGRRRFHPRSVHLDRLRRRRRNVQPVLHVLPARQKPGHGGAHTRHAESLAGRAETIPSTGFQFAETAENQSRFRTWLRYVRQDQMLFFWLLNSVTLLLFIFGALAVLHPQGIVPEKGTLIWDQSLILGKAFGRWGAMWAGVGRTIFLMVGVATLFSTQLALIDGVSRSISDIIYTNVKPAQKRPLSWWYMLIAVAWMATGCGIAFAMDYFKSEEQELGILLQAAYMGGFAMAVYVPLMLYINLRYLPKSARPGAVSIIMMLGAAALYGGFAVMSLWGELQSRFG